MTDVFKDKIKGWERHEAQVLCATLFEEKLQDEILSQVEPNDFFHEKFAAIIYLLKKFKEKYPGSFVDWIKLAEIAPKLIAKERLTTIYGGADITSFLTAALTNHTSSANYQYHLDEVLTASQRRKVYKLYHNGKQSIMNPVNDVNEIINDIETGIMKASKVSGNSTMFQGNDLVEYRKRQIVDRLNSPPPIMTGFKTIDRFMSEGFEKGKISIIAGRPSTGKSSIRANLIIHFLKAGYSVINFSPEQGGRSETDRLDTIFTQIPIYQIKRMQDWSKEDRRWGYIQKSIDWFSKQNYYLLDTPRLYYDDLWKFVRKIQMQGKTVDFLIVDLFKDLGDFISNTEERVITDKLLLRAEHDCKKYNIHLIIVHQLNREVENRASGIPKLRDLKGAGVYEEKASNIFFVHREARRNFDEEIEDNEMKVIIAKQREGMSPIIIPMCWNGETLTLYDKEEKEPEEQPLNIADELPNFEDDLG